MLCRLLPINAIRKMFREKQCGVGVLSKDFGMISWVPMSPSHGYARVEEIPGEAPYPSLSRHVAEITRTYVSKTILLDKSVARWPKIRLFNNRNAI